MREAYTASLNIACGALIGAIIVITTIKLLPNQTPKDDSTSRKTQINHDPAPIITSNLFESPLPKGRLSTQHEEGQKEGWEMAEECDSPSIKGGASFDDLVELKSGDLLAQIGACSENQILVVGVAGGTGSGKTTLAQAIRDSLQRPISFLSHDNYYKDLTHLTKEERDDHNFDHPDSLDTDLLLEDLKKLKTGQSVDIPTYDFATHMRTTDTVHVPAHRIVLVEGILIFTHEMLRNEMDIRIFVDTADDIRLIRRMSRDISERGRTPDSVIKQYMKTVRPMHHTFVEPSKQHAHVIVPVGLNQAVLDLIISRLRFAAGE